MMKWLRGKRLDLKTSIVILVIAIAIWAVFAYLNMQNLVPPELLEPGPNG